MILKPPAIDPRTNVKADGYKISVGAWMYKNGNPITIVMDNGAYYEYIQGHHSLNGSNNRSDLTF